MRIPSFFDSILFFQVFCRKQRSYNTDIWSDEPLKANTDLLQGQKKKLPLSGSFDKLLLLNRLQEALYIREADTSG